MQPIIILINRMKKCYLVQVNIWLLNYITDQVKHMLVFTKCFQVQYHNQHQTSGLSQPIFLINKMLSSSILYHSQHQTSGVVSTKLFNAHIFTKSKTSVQQLDGKNSRRMSKFDGKKAYHFSLAFFLWTKNKGSLVVL